jgi:cytochrome bd-type quinol oxidase subunit 1
MAMFIVLYIVLGALFLYLLNNKIQHGPEPLEEVETAPVSTLPDTFRQVFRRRTRSQ